MSGIELTQIEKYEKQLLKFNSYSFDNYSRLKLVFVNLKCCLEKEDALNNTQIQLDLACEVDAEIQALQDLRYADNKAQEFTDRVNRGLSIVKRIKHYTSCGQEVKYHQSARFLDFFKRFFTSELRHS